MYDYIRGKNYNVFVCFYKPINYIDHIISKGVLKLVNYSQINMVI